MVPLVVAAAAPLSLTLLPQLFCLAWREKVTKNSCWGGTMTFMCSSWGGGGRIGAPGGPSPSPSLAPTLEGPRRHHAHPCPRLRRDEPSHGPHEHLQPGLKLVGLPRVYHPDLDDGSFPGALEWKGAQRDCREVECPAVVPRCRRPGFTGAGAGGASVRLPAGLREGTRARGAARGGRFHARGTF